MSRVRFDPVDLDALKGRVRLSALFEQLGFRVRGRGVGWALCPFHVERSGSCKVNDDRGQFYCFGCGAQGDHFDVLMYVRNLSFLDAVQELGGVRPVSPAERKQIEERQQRAALQEAEDRRRQRTRLEGAWARAKPIENTHAAAYLAARGIPAFPDWTFDLRFAPVLQYRGFPNPEANEPSDLGEYPAMVAAIRGPGGEVIGLHRTYLDPSRPQKLAPPGDTSRNKAKKVLGEQRGGLIWLSPRAARVGVGEGIETSRSWLILMAEKEPETGLCAGVSLGNLSGRSTGSVPHPEHKKKRVPNGLPDLGEAGIVWPDEVEEIVFIGDGDSDPAMTSARLLCAMARARAQGKQTWRQPAPAGMDFNDVLLAEAA